MLNYFLSVSVLLLLIGCSNGAREQKRVVPANMKVVHVDLNKESKVVYSKLFETPTFVRLQTGKDFLIGNIDKILLADNKFFIADKAIAESLLVFDEKGKFICRVGKKGDGPGEYSEIRDIAIDQENKQVCILDLMGRKIIYYNYDGTYIRYAPMPFLFSGISFIDSKTMAYFTSSASNDMLPEINNYSLVVGSTKGEVMNTAFHFDDVQRNFTYFNAHHLRKFGTDVYYYPRYSDTVFKVSQQGVEAVYALDFGKYGIPARLKDNIIDDTQFRELTEKYYLFSGDFVDLQNGACFVVNTPEGNYNVYYSRQSNSTYTGKQVLIDNPLYSFMQYPAARYSNNTIVSSCKPMEVLGLKGLFANDTSKAGKELYAGLKESDNPILFFYTLKEFK